eukprot:3228332-Heterocapsa_arctica.AAC.1
MDRDFANNELHFWSSTEWDGWQARHEARQTGDGRLYYPWEQHPTTLPRQPAGARTHGETQAPNPEEGHED